MAHNASGSAKNGARAARSSVSTARGCLGGLLFMPGAPAAAFIGARLGSRLMQRAVLSILYGEYRYAMGLRIVNKQGLLSDGTHLREFPLFLVGAGGYAGALAFLLLAFLLAAWVGRDPLVLKMVGATMPERPRRTPVANDYGESTIPPRFRGLVESGATFEVVSIEPAATTTVPNGKLTVVFGRVVEGTVRPGNAVRISGADSDGRATVVVMTSIDGPLTEARASAGAVALTISGRLVGLAPGVRFAVTEG